MENQAQGEINQYKYMLVEITDDRIRSTSAQTLELPDAEYKRDLVTMFKEIKVKFENLSSEL